ncbi:Aquaporin-like Protein [Tribolium castaneum]|uniref:Aquaporin-like Protein n=1 Tax=Tribolium castaneum TaxID=7070 RepID=D6WL12_TRICA|nr:PREDICTED: aquaporin AQPcic [Tribolium castaneum]EFA04049.2 Aquaporin-like Protein [Tribolium castaneum]|eukprot:XP_970912.2 PREDICTED: aquaporin AQPcic [Tribolium castaneum]
MHLKFWEKIKVSGHSSLMDKITIALAEFFGTAILLFIGCLGCTYRFPAGIGVKGVEDLLHGSFAFGLAVMIAIQCFGHISGGHVNPSLTIAAVIVGYVPLVDALFFFLGQFLGAICGFGLMKLLIPVRYIHALALSTSEKAASDSAGVCSGVMHIRDENGIVMEFFMTFVLVLVACAVWDARNKTKTDSTPIRFGLTVVGIAIAAGPYTGGHINPARTLAPAILNNYWVSHWAYWVGQLAGAFGASLIYSILFSSSESSEAPTYDEEKN